MLGVLHKDSIAPLKGFKGPLQPIEATGVLQMICKLSYRNTTHAAII